MIWRVYMILICALACRSLNVNAPPENELLEPEWAYSDNVPDDPTVSGNLINNGTTTKPTNGSSVTESGTLSKAEPHVHSMRHKLKTTRLAMIREYILASLGLKEPPQIIKPIPATEIEHIVQVFKNTISKSEELERQNEDHLVKSLKVIQGSCNSPAGLDVLFWKNTSTSILRLFFDVSSYQLDDYTFISANLKLHKKLPKVPRRTTPKVYDGKTRSNGTKSTSTDDESVDIGSYDNESEVRVTVYQLRHKRSDSFAFNRKLLDTLAVPVNLEGWLEFSVITAVKKWIASPDKNYGLEIHVEDIPNEENYDVSSIEFDIPNCDNTSSNKPPTVPNMYETFEPLLEVLTISEMRSRSIRSSSDDCMSSGTCCASPLYVSFEDLGWNHWILAPTGFNTAFCTGSCIPLQTSDKSNLPRSYFWQRASLTSPEKNYCCGPTKLKPLRVLYITKDGSYGITSLNDFIVQQCGCRS